MLTATLDGACQIHQKINEESCRAPGLLLQREMHEVIRHRYGAYRQDRRAQGQLKHRMQRLQGYANLEQAMDMVLAHADLVEAHFFDCGEACPDVNKKRPPREFDSSAVNNSPGG